MSLFGNTANTANEPGKSLFGSLNQPRPATPSLFGNAAASQPQTSSLFGNTAASQPQANSLFGQPAQQNQQQQQQQQQPQAAPSASTGIFGQQGGLFGSSQPQQQQGTSLFGQANQQQQQQQGGSSLFGNAGSSLFGAKKPEEQGKSLFGGLGQSQQQQQQQQQQSQQQQQQQAAQDKQYTGSRIWGERDMQSRQRTVGEQIQLVHQKWNPESTSSSFHTYLYNTVSPDAAPFYRPDPSENEDKWEEALAKAPTPGSIPVLVKGFQQLGQRILHQERHLTVLRGRLHEINDGLAELLRRHSFEVATRVADAHRRHVRLAQRALQLAARAQVLRSRGYALDAAEERLAQQLALLEKRAADPLLAGGAEEVWARLLGVRERARLLQAELERGGGAKKGEVEGEGLDEETMKKAQKILED